MSLRPKLVSDVKVLPVLKGMVDAVYLKNTSQAEVSLITVEA